MIDSLPGRAASAEGGVCWRGQLLKRSLQLYMFGLFLLVPAHELWYHFVLKPVFNGGGALFYPENLLVLGLAVLFWRELVDAFPTWQPELVLLGVYSIAYWASVMANPESVGKAATEFPVAWLLPILAALLVTVAIQRFNVNPDKHLLPWMFSGIALICAVGIVAYLLGFGLPTSFYEFVYVFRTYKSLSGAKGGVWYGDLTMGNYNVFAGALVTAFLVWLGWQQDRPRSRTWYRQTATALWVTLVAVNFYICYSRGAIITLNFCFALFLLASVWVHGSWRRQIHGMVALLVFDLLLIAPPGAIDHWRGLLRPSETNSAVQRLRQWQEVTKPSDQLTDPRWVSREIQEQSKTEKELPALALGAHIPETTPAESVKRPSRSPGTSRWTAKLRYYLLGLGPGTYGLVVGFGANANTHNLFVKQLVTCGGLGLVPFVALYGFLLARGRPRRPPSPYASGRCCASWVGLVAIGLAGILTQYEFGYLGVSTGGVLFWLSALLSRRQWPLPTAPGGTHDQRNPALLSAGQS